MAPLADVDGYLARIGLPVLTTVAEVHRAHATSIAFENFDPATGHPVSLDPARVEDKLITRRRGGYCFEQNLLLAAALESLGVTEIAPMLARVRLGPEGTPRPLNHLLLRVVDGDATWLADVGFGGGGLLDPVPFAVGVESEQSGWRYRLMEDGGELVLQVFQDGGWTDMYGFVPEPVPHVDIEVNNWFTATHPESPFVTGVMAGARQVDRCLSLFVSGSGNGAADDDDNNTSTSQGAVLVERPLGGSSSISEVPLDEVPALLAARFGIEGVTRRADGRFGIA
jgi:N-hydroxyarylamine O-acetyltransferase